MGFEYIKNRLHLVARKSRCDIEAVAKKVGRPFYFYDLEGMEERLKMLIEVSPKIASAHYAMKANDNPFILKCFAKLGVGVDVVSGGELQLALDCGFSAKKIVFSGVGKSVAEIQGAIFADIKQINVESPAELYRIGEIAKSMNRKVNVALRMNPDVDPETHPYIRTGFRENKFGMDESFIPVIDDVLGQFKEHLILKGLTLHIGSQIRELEPFIDAIKKTLPIYHDFKAKGHNMATFDVGGGVGIDYENDLPEADIVMLKEYGEILESLLGPVAREILLEPGRIVVGRYGLLLGEVQYIKESPHKKFVILNTGMHHLMRPALYQAHHRILPVVKSEGVDKRYDVVGPICESADTLGRDRVMPEVFSGDWLAVMDAGAYGAVMASGYNRHDPPLEIIYYKAELYQGSGEVFS